MLLIAVLPAPGNFFLPGLIKNGVINAGSFSLIGDLAERNRFNMTVEKEEVHRIFMAGVELGCRGLARGENLGVVRVINIVQIVGKPHISQGAGNGGAENLSDLDPHHIPGELGVDVVEVGVAGFGHCLNGGGGAQQRSFFSGTA